MDYYLVGQKIKKERIRLGLTQEQFAEEIDVSPGYLAHIERGSRTPSLQTFINIISVLKVSADYLLSEVIDTDSTIYIGELSTLLKDMNPKDVDRYSEILKIILQISKDNQ